MVKVHCEHFKFPYNIRSFTFQLMIKVVLFILDTLTHTDVCTKCYGIYVCNFGDNIFKLHSH